MLLKPWYDVIKPRKNLCEEIIPEALEFAVHLDKVRNGRAIEEYSNPEYFFTRNHLSKNLLYLAIEVVRRLSGETSTTHTSFHVVSPFGGGKTHALTLLYHLVRHGADAHKWPGVQKILSEAGVPSLPKARVAAFVGSEFESLKGLGGKRGEPLRKTPWGEIAFQLGGKNSFANVAEYDHKMVAPDEESFRDVLPKDEPCLILIDDLIRYLARYRSKGMAAQCYHFLQGLSEHVQSLNNIVLVSSIPSTENGMDAEDRQNLQRYSELFEQFSTPISISTEDEIAEIIRRRLFDWEAAEATSPDGKVPLPDDAIETCIVYAAWVRKYRLQLPDWFPFEQTEQIFMNSYPFHPSTLSVFERKWKPLPHFQHTRGILHLMALLIANAYKEGYSRVYSDPLICPGAAPLDDPDFREAVRIQLGADERLETSIMIDICGRDAFALGLDSQASDEIKHNRLHLKVATAIFFESNGGMDGENLIRATEPEIRFAIEEPDLNIEHVKTVLEGLSDQCYYLTREDRQYRFSLTPNLNKSFADRSSDVDEDRITERIRTSIKNVFTHSEFVIFFPERSEDIPDRPVLTLAVLSPEYTRRYSQTIQLIETVTNNYGASERTFKSAIIWVVADDETQLNEEARKLLTWKAIQNEIQSNNGLFQELSDFDPVKIRAQITTNVKKSQKTLQDIVWQTYGHVALLNKENTIEFPDLGQFEPGPENSLSAVILHQLRLYDYVVESVSPRFLVRNWPDEFQDKEWSTQSVQDLFFVSPLFPRLLNPDIIKDTIAKGVSTGHLGYVGPKIEGKYEPLYYQKVLIVEDVEISEDRFIITPEKAEAYLSGIVRPLKSLTVDPPRVDLTDGEKLSFIVHAMDEDGEEIKKNVLWEATGGTIDENGVFTVEEKERADFEIRATAGDQSAWVKVRILPKTPESPEIHVDHIPVEEIQETLQQETVTTRLSWSGEVTGKNWTALYKKALSQFSTDHTMKISLNVEVLREEGISPEHIEAMKSALRELGLNDDVQEKGKHQDKLA